MADIVHPSGDTVVKMTCSLTDLPVDLVNQIWVNMESCDQINLISTSWHFRMLLGSEFFQTIKPSNGYEKLVDTYDVFSKGKSASLVKHIEFDAAFMPMDESIEAIAIRKDDIEVRLWQQKSLRLLSRLHRFSNLESITIGFNSPHQDHNVSAVSCFCTGAWTSLDLDDTMDAEQEPQTFFTWCALLPIIFNALSLSHSERKIRNLLLRNVPPVGVLSFYGKRFRTMIGELESLSLSLWGQNLPNDCHPQNNERYQQYVRDLSFFFFTRIPNIENLEVLAGSGAAWFSSQHPVWKEQKFALKLTSFPKIKRIHLAHFYLSLDLMDFFRVNIQTLETIVLENCFAYKQNAGFEKDPAIALANMLDDPSSKTPTWSDFFLSLTATRAPRLKSVGLRYTGRPQSTAPSASEAKLNEELTKNTGHQPFAYGADDQMTGHVVCLWDVTLAHYLTGNDQKAFDDLMGLVQMNKMENPWKLRQLAKKYSAAMRLNGNRKPLYRTW